MFNRPPYPETAAARFAWIMESFHLIVFRRAFMQGPHTFAILRRISGLRDRVSRLLLHVIAGTLPPVRARHAEASARPASVPRTGRLPERLGWLAAMWPPNTWHVNEFRVQGQSLLNLLGEPEMAAIVAQAPDRFGRVFRPLLSMLGMEIPPEFRLPKRERPKRRRVVAEAVADVPPPDAAPMDAAPTDAAPTDAPPVRTSPSPLASPWRKHGGSYIPRGVPRLPPRLREKTA